MNCPAPSSSEMLSPFPPGNSTSSILPTKLIPTRSPFAASRSTTSDLRYCSAMRSSALSTSSLGMSATSFSTPRSSNFSSGSSGSTSTDILYSRSVPSFAETISTRGGSAGRRLFCCIASAELAWTWLSSTSPRTALPKRVFRRPIGTFPGRNPGSRMVFEISPRRRSISLSRSPAGTTIRYSRLSPSAFVSVTCIAECSRSTAYWLATRGRHAWRHPVRRWCGRGDSNSHDFHRWNLNPVRLPVSPRPQRPSPGCGVLACPFGDSHTNHPLLRGGLGSRPSRQALHRRGGDDLAFAAIGLMVGLDVGEPVAVVDHDPGRLPQPPLRRVAEPVELLDAGAVRQVEMRDRVERAAAASFLVDEVVRAQPQQRRLD